MVKWWKQKSSKMFTSQHDSNPQQQVNFYNSVKVFKTTWKRILPEKC